MQRSLQALRDRGMTATPVERFVKSKRGGFRQDLLGIADILAFPTPNPLGDSPREDGFTLLVQTCPSKNLAAHLTKLLREPRTVLWLASCDRHRLELHGWGFQKGKTCRRSMWHLRRVVLTYSGGQLRHRGSEVETETPEETSPASPAHGVPR